MKTLFRSARRFVPWLYEGRRGKLLLRGLGSEEQEDLWFDGVVYLALPAEINGLEIRTATPAENKKFAARVGTLTPVGEGPVPLLFVLKTGDHLYGVGARGAWKELARLVPGHPAFHAPDYADLVEDEDFRAAHILSRQLLSA
jgi:hypothetical protein